MKKILPWLAVALILITAVLVMGKREKMHASADRVSRPPTLTRRQPAREITKPISSSIPARDDKLTKADLDQMLMEEVRKEESTEHTIFGETLGLADVEKLRELARGNLEDYQTMSSLSDFFFLAAAAKDIRFRDLLDEIHIDPTCRLGLALSAYDYAVTGNQAALQSILNSFQQMAAKKTPGDSNELWVLSVVDEWDLTRATILATRMSADGTAGEAAESFWRKRRFLFPHNKDFPDDAKVFEDQVFHRKKQTAPPPLSDR